MCPWPIPCTRSMDASNGWSSTTKRFALVGGPALGRSPVPACSWSGTGPFWLILADGARPWMELASRGAVFDVGRRGWWPGARPSGSGVSRTGTCRPLSRVAGMFPCGMRFPLPLARTLYWGRHVPVRDEGVRREREILEKGMGVAVPRRGQRATGASILTR